MPADNDAREWLRYAHMDLSSAAFLRGHRPIPVEIICYHCQQAAEKAIKAIFVHYNADIPHIHDLTKLLDAASQYDDAVMNIFRQANRLTNYAVFTRYPGDNELSESDVEIALQYAEAVLTHIEFLLFSTDTADEQSGRGGVGEDGAPPLDERGDRLV
jgi:HEPN domain-containing protein